MLDLTMSAGLGASSFLVGFLVLIYAPHPGRTSSGTPVTTRFVFAVAAGLIVGLTCAHGLSDFQTLLDRGGEPASAAKAGTFALLLVGGLGTLLFPLLFQRIFMVRLLRFRLFAIGLNNGHKETPAWWISLAVSAWVSVLIVVAAIAKDPRVFSFSTGTGVLLAHIGVSMYGIPKSPASASTNATSSHRS